MNWFKSVAVPSIATGMIRTLAALQRIELHDQYGLVKNPPTGPAIFVMWHNRLLLMPCFYQHFFNGRRAAALISRSRDGEIIADICARLGVRSVRGSSSKKALAAFREMVRFMEEDHLDIVVTPDGPRGPKYQLQPGVLQLSQLTGAPIVPCTCHYSSKWTIPSWDEFQIPKPFSRCKIILQESIVVPKDIEDLAPYAERLTRELGI